MTKLEELYKRRKVFVDYNIEIPSELINEIVVEENLFLEKTCANLASLLPETLETDSIDHIAFGAEYINGRLMRIAIDTMALDGIFPFTQDIVHKATEPIRIEKVEPARKGRTEEKIEDSRRGRSIGFSVKFGDGKIIKYPTAQRTMIETLRYIGLSRVSNYRGITFNGYPLVGKERRISVPQRRWQKNVDGWWVYVNMANAKAIASIKGVAKMLNVPLEVIMDEEIEESKEPDFNEYTKKSNNRLYSLNGGAPLKKSALVWHTVNAMLFEMPNATFDEILDFFPRNLQGSYGVVRTVADIKDRIRRHRTEERRWFLAPKEILMSGDGIRFAVSKEWGTNFNDFCKHVIKEFGWRIDEIKS